jgi:hypothetical protein
MITLKTLRASIDDYILNNPHAKDYPVIGFNWYDSKTEKINPIESHHWLVTDTRSNREFIYDTIEEIQDDNLDDNFRIKKVILLK